MEQKYLMDTNVVIGALGNHLTNEAKQFVANLSPVISAVTYMEALGWYKANEQQLDPLRKFMSVANILSIDKTVIEKTVEIRQQKKIGLGDAIIAATAVTHRLILLTRNEADLRNIKDLQIINPWSVK